MTDDENVRKAIEAAKNMSSEEWKRQLTEPSARLDHEVDEEINWQREKSANEIFTSLWGMVEKAHEIQNESDRRLALDVWERVETYILLSKEILNTNRVEDAFALGWELACAQYEAILALGLGNHALLGEANLNSLSNARKARNGSESVARDAQKIRNEWICAEWRKALASRSKKPSGAEFRGLLIRANRSLPQEIRLFDVDEKSMLSAKQIIRILDSKNLWDISV